MFTINNMGPGHRYGLGVRERVFRFPERTRNSFPFLSVQIDSGPRRGVEAYLYYFFNLGAIGGWVVNDKSRSLNPRERGPLPIV